MKRFILWGAGRYGNLLKKLIDASDRTDIKIVALADRDYETLNRRLQGKSGDKAIGLEECKELIKAGRADAVVAASCDGYTYSNITGELIANRLPVATLMSRDQVIDETPAAHTVRRETLESGYALEIISDVKAAIFSQPRSVTYYFTGDAQIMSAGAYPSHYRFLAENCPISPSDHRFSTTTLDEACIFTNLWQENYWHFTFECLDKIYLLERMGFRGVYVVFDQPHIRQLFKILEIESDRTIYVEQSDAPTLLTARRLYHISPKEHQGETDASVLCKAAERVSEKLTRNNLKYPKRLYVKRIGVRKLTGADETLRSYGFETMIPEEYSLTEQMNYFYNAELVLCAHGANSTNSIYMRTGASFIETFGYGYIHPYCMNVLREKGVHYHMMTQNQPAWSGVEIHPTADYEIAPEVMKTILEDEIDRLKSEGRLKD